MTPIDTIDTLFASLRPRLFLLSAFKMSRLRRIVLQRSRLLQVPSESNQPTLVPSRS